MTTKSYAILRTTHTVLAYIFFCDDLSTLAGALFHALSRGRKGSPCQSQTIVALRSTSTAI